MAFIFVIGFALLQTNSVSHASESIFDIPLSNPSVGSGWSSNDRNEHQSDLNSAVDSANDYTDSELDKIQGEINKTIEDIKNQTGMTVLSYTSLCTTSADSEHLPIYTTSYYACPDGKRLNLKSISGRYGCKYYQLQTPRCI